LEASTNTELAKIQPLYDIPSKLSCNVIGIQLKVENYINELYAEVALLPDTTDMSHPTPTQEIVATDLHENGETLIGTRRVGHQEGNIPSVLVSSHRMQHGVIASAMNAFKTKILFTVFYKLRSSQFIVSFDKYLDAVNNKFNVNSRFAMLFEDDDFNEKRYSGKITVIEDLSSYWRNSEWRNLKVQWDEVASIQRPNRISSWDIEIFAPSSIALESSLLKNKRQFQLVEIGSNLWTPTLTQCQEMGQSSMNSLINVPQFSYHDSVDDSKILFGWLMYYIVPTKETVSTTTRYKLFGVDLRAPNISKDTVGLIDSNGKSEISKICEENKLSQPQDFTTPKNNENKQIKSHRSRSKVQMQGVAIGRTVDLTVFCGYNELIDELEKLFDLKDELRIPNQWEIIFIDDEKDIILVGDNPWPILQSGEENTDMPKREGSDNEIGDDNSLK
ncbi:unnamed protein product, partial [Thlaspi arvense]